jgi:protein-S-isoprenylcysteine O-methyltransferase Ste14
MRHQPHAKAWGGIITWEQKFWIKVLVVSSLALGLVSLFYQELWQLYPNPIVAVIFLLLICFAIYCSYASLIFGSDDTPAELA